MQSAITLGGTDGFGEQSSPQPGKTPRLLAMARRWKLILAITVLCVLAAGIRLLLVTPVYRSDARLFLRRGSLQVIGDSGNSYASNMQTQCRVLTSTRILAGAAARALPKAPRTLGGGNAVAKLAEGILASPIPGEDLVAIAYEGPEPSEAAAVLQGIIDVYTQFHAERKAQVLGQWQKDLNRLQAEVETKSKQLDELRQRSESTVENAGVGGTTREDLTSLREALNAAGLEAFNAQSAYQASVAAFAAGQASVPLESLRLTVDPLADDPTLNALREQLNAARQRLTDVRSRYLENHPNVLSAVKNVASLENALDQANQRASENYVASLKQRAAYANDRRNRLQEQYQALAISAARQSRNQGEMERREAELQRSQKLMDSIVGKMQAFRLDADASNGTVDVVEYPSIRLEPIKPHKSRDLISALLGGLVLGSGLALVLSFFDQRVRSAAELAIHMRLPVLGAIPSVPGELEEYAAGRIVVNDPAGDTAEAFRCLRTAVLFTSGQREPRTILITSAQAGEGKSTLAANLAIAMARSGRKVLLLDADLRKPVQHRIFKSLARGDLGKIIAGDQTLESAIQASEVEHLSLLLCGHAPEHPSELLNSRGFSALLEELSVRYDHVIIDSPPVSVASDARILSAFSTVSLLVVRADRTRRHAVKLAFEALSSVGGTVLGMVLNHASHKDDRFGSYGYEYSERGKSQDERRGLITSPPNPVLALPNLNKTGDGGEGSAGLKSLPA